MRKSPASNALFLSLRDQSLSPIAIRSIKIPTDDIASTSMPSELWGNGVGLERGGGVGAIGTAEALSGKFHKRVDRAKVVNRTAVCECCDQT